MNTPSWTQPPKLSMIGLRKPLLKPAIRRKQYMNNRKRGVLRWLLLGALGSLALTQALAQAQTSEPPLTWQTCSACPEPPEIAFSGAPLWRGTAVTNILHLGRPQVPERASQNTSIHGASLPLPPRLGLSGGVHLHPRHLGFL